MGSQPGHWNLFSFHLLYIRCVEREPGSYHPRLPVALLYVVGCYAECTFCKDCAWNNKYSEQEEAALYIVKSLKENSKLVLQIRN